MGSRQSLKKSWKGSLKWLLRPLLSTILVSAVVIGIFFLTVMWGVIFPKISHKPQDSLALGTADMWRRSIEMATQWVTPLDNELFRLRSVLFYFTEALVPESSGYRSVNRKGLPLLQVIVLRRGDDLVNGIFAPIFLENEKNGVSHIGRTIFVNERESSSDFHASVAKGVLFLFEAADAYGVFADPRDEKDGILVHEDYRRAKEMGKIFARVGGARYHETLRKLAVSSLYSKSLDRNSIQAVVQVVNQELAQMFGAETEREKYLLQLLSIVHMRFYLVDLQVTDPEENEKKKIAVISELADLLGLGGGVRPLLLKDVLLH